MKNVLEYCAMGISILSIIIIIYGTLCAIVSIIRNEFSKDKYKGMQTIRVEFGSYLLLGLEILIGADIIQTIIEPSYEELIVLGGIVVIRTVMSLFLNKEIKELENES